jgi:hypothetical protein
LRFAYIMSDDSHGRKCISYTVQVNIIFERKIWLTANGMINRYGSDAGSRTVNRIETLLHDNDEEGITTWMRVLEAIEELVSSRPNGIMH